MYFDGHPFVSGEEHDDDDDDDDGANKIAKLNVYFDGHPSISSAEEHHLRVWCK